MVNKSLQNTGLKRNVIDKYYTKKVVVQLCMNAVRENITIDKNNDIIIEPSAGDGSFIEEIKNTCNNYEFYDLYPENVEIKKADYLCLELRINESKYNKIHVIGNPPFGRQSSQAVKFIKKSSTFCDTISFILPRSFKKDSMMKYFPLYYHLIYSLDLPNNSFTVEGKDYDVPCVFQIWEKKDIKRAVKEPKKPINYIFIKKTDNPDISFRRVGINAGKIDKSINDKSVQSHYFIKFANNILTDEMYDRLQNIKYECSSNTVGPKSISKQELINEFNKYTTELENIP